MPSGSHRRCSTAARGWRVFSLSVCMWHLGMESSHGVCGHEWPAGFEKGLLRGGKPFFKHLLAQNPCSFPLPHGTTLFCKENYGNRWDKLNVDNLTSFGSHFPGIELCLRLKSRYKIIMSNTAGQVSPCQMGWESHGKVLFTMTTFYSSGSYSF